MSLVKICGITNQGDAQAAVDYGADALGFILYDKSPRAITFEGAKKVIDFIPAKVLKVGVFVNATYEVLKKFHNAGIFDYYQLHGDISEKFYHEHYDKIIIAISVRDGDDLKIYKKYDKSTKFLFDTKVSGEYGGTGRVFDWNLLRTLPSTLSIVLAGGLNPDNVTEAIKQVNPYMVDVSSGVEISPGKKDPGKVKSFIMKAKNRKL